VTRDCHWASKREAIAASGDVARLHGLLFQDLRRRIGKLDAWSGSATDDPGPKCDTPVRLDAARGTRLDALLEATRRAHTPAAPFVQHAYLGDDVDDPAARDDADDSIAGDEDDEGSEPDWQRERRRNAKDLARVLVSTSAMYVQWPHVDGLFVDLYSTLPGRVTRTWLDGEDD
jgi:hypothetical protein